MIFKNSFPASQKTNCVSITVTWLVLFRKLFVVYCDNNLKQVSPVGKMQSS